MLRLRFIIFTLKKITEALVFKQHIIIVILHTAAAPLVTFSLNHYVFVSGPIELANMTSHCGSIDRGFV